MKKWIYIALGVFFVGLGFLGAFLPVLPTTPFLLLALWLFSRSSERWKHWLLTNRFCGKYLRDYHNGNGIPKRVKLYTLILLWAGIAWSAFGVIESWWVRCVLLAIAIGVTIHILRIKNKKMRLSNIIVLAPTQAEADAVSEHVGTLATVIVSGVGMAETAASVCKLAMQGKPDAVILAGIAGAYPGSGLSPGDCVIVGEEGVADLGAMREGIFTPLYEKTYVSPVAAGLRSLPVVASATVNTGGMPNIGGGASVENMEGAAFFSACGSMGTVFAQVRAVSNITTDTRDMWRIEEALSSLGKGVAKVIEELNEKARD